MSAENNDIQAKPDEPTIPQFPIDRIELEDIPIIPTFPSDRIEKGEKPGTLGKDE